MTVGGPVHRCACGEDPPCPWCTPPIRIPVAELMGTRGYPREASEDTRDVDPWERTTRYPWGPR